MYSKKALSTTVCTFKYVFTSETGGDTSYQKHKGRDLRNFLLPDLNELRLLRFRVNTPVNQSLQHTKSSMGVFTSQTVLKYNFNSYLIKEQKSQQIKLNICKNLPSEQNLS